MGFDPARLTGRRARRWAASITWASENHFRVPKAVLARVRRPQWLKHAARIRTGLGKYHWVLIVRNRVVLLDHPDPRAEKLAMDLVGKTEPPCECYRVLKKWEAIARTNKDRLVNRPADVPDGWEALRKLCRPPVGEYRKGWSRLVSGYYNTDRETLAPDDTRHPSRYVHPTSFADRWTRPGEVANGVQRISLVGGITCRIVDVITDHLGDVRLPFGGERADIAVRVFNRLVERQTYTAGRYASIPSGQDMLGFTTRTPDAPSILWIEINPYSWLSRVFHRGIAVISGQWLVTGVVGTGDVVIADAFDLGEVRRAAAKAVGAGGQPSTLYPSHGVLARRDGTWVFHPSPPRHPRGRATTTGIPAYIALEDQVHPDQWPKPDHWYQQPKFVRLPPLPRRPKESS